MIVEFYITPSGLQALVTLRRFRDSSSPFLHLSYITVVGGRSAPSEPIPIVVEP